MLPLQEAIAAAQALMDLEGVISVGEGKVNGEACVLVLVQQRTPELDGKIPGRIKGVRVEVREAEAFRAQ